MYHEFLTKREITINRKMAQESQIQSFFEAKKKIDHNEIENVYPFHFRVLNAQ